MLLKTWISLHYLTTLSIRFLFITKILRNGRVCTLSVTCWASITTFILIWTSNNRSYNIIRATICNTLVVAWIFAIKGNSRILTSKITTFSIITNIFLSTLIIAPWWSFRWILKTLTTLSILVIIIVTLPSFLIIFIAILIGLWVSKCGIALLIFLWYKILISFRITLLWRFSTNIMTSSS